MTDEDATRRARLRVRPRARLWSAFGHIPSEVSPAATHAFLHWRSAQIGRSSPFRPTAKFKPPLRRTVGKKDRDRPVVDARHERALQRDDGPGGEAFPLISLAVHRLPFPRRSRSSPPRSRVARASRRARTFSLPSRRPRASPPPRAPSLSVSFFRGADPTLRGACSGCKPPRTTRTRRKRPPRTRAARAARRPRSRREIPPPPWTLGRRPRSTTTTARDR